MVEFGLASSQWVRVGLPCTHGHPLKKKRFRYRERKGWGWRWLREGCSHKLWGPLGAITRSQEKAKEQRVPRIPEGEGPCEISSVNF